MRTNTPAMDTRPCVSPFKRKIGPGTRLACTLQHTGSQELTWKEELSFSNMLLDRPYTFQTSQKMSSSYFSIKVCRKKWYTRATRTPSLSRLTRSELHLPLLSYRHTLDLASKPPTSHRGLLYNRDPHTIPTKSLGNDFATSPSTYTSWTMTPRGDPSFDRLEKVRLLIDDLSKKFEEIYHPKNLAVDKVMIKAVLPQVYAYETNQTGVWVLGDSSSGYSADSTFTLVNQNLGSENIWWRRSPDRKNQHVFFNFFTSVKVLEDMEKDGIYSLEDLRTLDWRKGVCVFDVWYTKGIGGGGGGGITVHHTPLRLSRNALSEPNLQLLTIPVLVW